MTPATLRHLNEWFSTHVRTYYEEDRDHQENILLKEAHTRRVCEAMQEISAGLGLATEERALGYVSALFHDLGRFPQYRQYRTFRDSDSANHAKLALWELNRHKVLHDLPKPERFLICRAVIFHNRLQLPGNLDARTLLLARMLRDADKIDIWKVMLDHFARANERLNRTVELGLDRTPGVRDEVYHTILRGEIPDYRDLRTVDEFKVLQMGWVFDINFKPTFEMIRARRYMDRIVRLLPENPLRERTAQYVDSYIRERLAGSPGRTG